MERVLVDETISDKVQQILAQEFNINAEKDENLHFDSLRIVKLIVALEAAFDADLDSDLVTLESFATINSISQLIETTLNIEIEV